MEPNHQRLESARRHVQDGEQNIARQTAVISELKARDADTTSAQRALRVHIAFLQVARRALALEEEKARQVEVSYHNFASRMEP